MSFVHTYKKWEEERDRQIISFLDFNPRANIVDDKFKILFICRLTEQKGIDILCRKNIITMGRQLWTS